MNRYTNTNLLFSRQKTDMLFPISNNKIISVVFCFKGLITHSRLFIKFRNSEQNICIYLVTI